jgi:hypothetical protein
MTELGRAARKRAEFYRLNAVMIQMMKNVTGKNWNDYREPGREVVRVHHLEEGRMRNGRRLFVGGGQEYHGPDANRCREVVREVAEALYALVGDTVEVVTGGMPGIPHDFARAWPGLHVLCVVSSEYERDFVERNTGFAYIVAGQSQEARRLAVTKLAGLRCAFFVQGEQYSAHEMQLLHERGVPIVPFEASGGASGGLIDYKGWRMPQQHMPESAGQLAGRIAAAFQDEDDDLPPLEEDDEDSNQKRASVWFNRQ